MTSGNSRWDGVGAIWEIIDRLRGEPGCPWDRKQTPESVQTYLIEEAHEAASAVRSGDTADAADELGDLLFMVLFMIHLYEEMGAFRLEEVCRLICEKMIRRHPHVFGEVSVETAQEVRDNWEQIKAGEKAASGKGEGRVPRSLPALMRAYRMASRLDRDKAASWNNAKSQLQAIDATLQGIHTKLNREESASEAELGEAFLLLVNLARLTGYRAEDVLHERLRDLENTGTRFGAVSPRSGEQHGENPRQKNPVEGTCAAD
ncbi:MAG: MazG family protein [Syntrophobacteraceae bacterium]